MRDDDLAFVELVQRELGVVRWPDAAELRARARRRSRRRVVGAAAVVFVLLSSSAVATAGLPGLSGPPTATGPAASPTGRAEIPLDALLQPEDLPVKAGSALTGAGLGEPIVIEPVWAQCLAERNVSPIWEMSRYSRSQSFVRDPRTDQDMQLSQDVYRIGPELAASFSADIDRRIRPCLDWLDVQTGQNVGLGPVIGELTTSFARHSWEVVARGFAGDDAVLIRHTTSETRRDDAPEEVLAEAPDPQTVAVVRVGDLVTVLRLGVWASESDYLRLAVVATRRMCLAANPRC
ncbi:hypothetical protein [Micromonospora narathiwatensis]|uniref:PknH-like extracellular domain-containing protein n=1 Tax=Micromonospora narathiwatensis TaxID=299146 RepID=A0A1A9AEN2_9ACTN|nr:hypothetical protein [Micromonospora narathiwatensis]SBT54573.1 hypothetical protein GA0070621_5538 [Micromonospora narathiwatensis]